MERWLCDWQKCLNYAGFHGAYIAVYGVDVKWDYG